MDREEISELDQMNMSTESTEEDQMNLSFEAVQPAAGPKSADLEGYHHFEQIQHF